MRLAETELILNQDGSVYHLGLLPDDIAGIIILVGDPDRVSQVSRCFARIEIKKQKREFITHTGFFRRQRLTVISTGISTDNIDIVFNEIDALANIDLKTRLLKPESRQLKFIRIGTAGGLQPDMLLDSYVLSENAVGLDGLTNYYSMTFNLDELSLAQKFSAAFTATDLHPPYVMTGDTGLIDLFSKKSASDKFLLKKGISVTCPGFYGPQGRELRIKPKIADFPQRLMRLGMSNFEMETAGIYAMGRLLNHPCCSLSAIVANRITGEFSQNVYLSVDYLIQFVLETLCFL